MPRGHGRGATPLLSPLLIPGHKHRHGQVTTAYLEHWQLELPELLL